MLNKGILNIVYLLSSFRIVKSYLAYSIMYIYFLLISNLSSVPD